MTEAKRSAATPPDAARAAPTAAPAVVRVHSAQLFAGAQEVQIVHQGGVYRLKQTALGKLILTK